MSHRFQVHRVENGKAIWELNERETTKRGILTYRLVRQVVVGFAAGQLSDGNQEDFREFSSVTKAKIDRIYRDVYLSTTLKREEMLDEGERMNWIRLSKANEGPQIDSGIRLLIPPDTYIEPA